VSSEGVSDVTDMAQINVKKIHTRKGAIIIRERKMM
jgi:hypothetical protein